MAAGPLGHVAVATSDVGESHGVPLSCWAPSVVLDASGTVTGGPDLSAEGEECFADCDSLAFDPSDNLLYGFDEQSTSSPVPAGMTTVTSGFLAGPVSLSYTYTNSPIDPASYTFSAGLLGRDMAGDTFAQVTVGGAGIDFGGGVVSGDLLLEYTGTGAFVRSIAPPAGSLAFGALGHIFSSTQATGTVDYGCGTVGTAAVTSTVLTSYDQTGACLWSQALPASTAFALDPSENVLLATTFAGTVDFGGGPLTSVGTSDLAIAKLDAFGGFVWSESFGASGASVSGVSSLGATGTGGEALSVGISGAVDFGCGAVSSSAGATTLFADFDATGTVVYSSVVALLGGGWTQSGPVVDGLGGISFAVQVSSPGPYPIGGNIVVSRFAP